MHWWLVPELFQQVRKICGGKNVDTVKIKKGNTKIVAHRGLSGLECENTNAAFVAAGNRSYFGVETDVHVTADGKLILIHDDNTERVAGDKLEVEKSTYSELKKLRLYDRLNKTHRSDLVLPDLIDYIRICKRYEKIAVLEIKNPMQERDILKILKEIDNEDYLEKTILISFCWENLEIVKNNYPKQKVQFLTKKCDSELVEKLKKFNIDLDIEYHRITPELVEKLHKNGIEINCWTCDDKTIGEKLVSFGVDYITSNILE